MRKEKYITIDKEMSIITNISTKLLNGGFNASNSTIIIVSTDYSSIFGQILRHNLSHDEEIVSGFGIDVPYPDEEWDDKYVKELSETFKIHANSLKNKNLILVEAAVIRGGNYTFVVDWLRKNVQLDKKIITVALFENINSKFASNFVGEYYRDDTEDITFWWESKNKHWKD